jgi:radical SAM additional 4Fe4S-binding domain
MGYKPSKYNYYLNSEDGKRFIVYNTRTGAVLTGSNDEFNLLDFLENNGKYQENKYFDSMISAGIIVEERIDEMDLIKTRQNCIEDFKITLTILPTMRCNFVCPYCYVTDSGFNRITATMNTNILRGILKYIENICKNKKIKTCEIIWFGGEPLLEVGKIEFFMKGLFILANKYEFLTTSTIVTNGYLLEQKIFIRLYNVGVRIFQITLDGSEKNHDRYRKLPNGKGTFRKIFNNLVNISRNNLESEVLISIRANFLENNVDDMYDLVDIYADYFKNDRRFSISFRPIVNITGSVKNAVEIKNEARNIEQSLNEKLLQNGIEVEGDSRMFSRLPEPIKSWCGAGEFQNYIINYDGKIYLCDAYIGNADESVGYLTNGGEIVTNKKCLEKWTRTVFEENNSTCLLCKRFPICAGGCKKEFMEVGRHICHWDDSCIYESLYRIIESD